MAMIEVIGDKPGERLGECLQLIHISSVRRVVPEFVVPGEYGENSVKRADWKTQGAKLHNLRLFTDFGEFRCVDPSQFGVFLTRAQINALGEQVSPAQFSEYPYGP